MIVRQLLSYWEHNSSSLVTIFLLAVDIMCRGVQGSLSTGQHSDFASPREDVIRLRQGLLMLDGKYYLFSSQTLISV